MLIAPRPRRRDRRGSVAVELILVFPFLLLAVAGMVEFGLFLSGEQRLDDAAARGARLGARGADDAAIERHIREQVLPGRLGQEVAVKVTRGFVPAQGAEHSRARRQEYVTVVVTVPARSVAPDVLSSIGIRLSDEVAAGRAVMLVE